MVCWSLSLAKTTSHAVVRNTIASVVLVSMFAIVYNNTIFDAITTLHRFLGRQPQVFQYNPIITNPLSSPLVSKRNTKESLPNPRVCHLTYWMRHFACNTLNTTVFHILLLTLCASLEYNCLNPGIFTVLPIIRFMACSLALYAECMKTAVFKRRDEKYILLTAPFPLRSHIIDLLMVCFHVDLHSVPLALSLGVATLVQPLPKNRCLHTL